MSAATAQALQVQQADGLERAPGEAWEQVGQQPQPGTARENGDHDWLPTG